MKTGIELIAAERERQVSQEGFTSDHDAKHLKDELAWAACYYAMPGFIFYQCPCHLIASIDHERVFAKTGWHKSWAKRGGSADRIRDLTKAGALIAAEIDRLQAKKSAGEATSKDTPKDELIDLPPDADLDSVREDYHFKLMAMLIRIDRHPVEGIHSILSVDYCSLGLPRIEKFLKTLEAEGLLRKRQFVSNDDIPLYTLTEKGKKIKSQIRCVPAAGSIGA